MRVPEGWSIKSISDVGNVITGSTPSTTHSEYYGGEIPFISPADLGVRKFISTSTKTLTDTGFNCTRKIRKGATLFTCIGSTIGKIGLSNVDLATNQQINAVVPHDNYDDEYVYYALSNRAIQIAKIAGNQAVPIINKSTFAAQLLLTPPLPEQQKIAQILSTWDKAITTTEQLLANSQHQKKALMQQLLTGKKRLLDEDGVRFSDVWEHNILGKLIKEVKGEKEENPNVIELLTVKLHYKGAVRSGKYPNATERGRPYFKRFENELIIGRQNLHNGGVAIVPKNCDGLIASNAISSFENRTNVNINFILSIMSTAHFRFLVDNLTGGTGQKEVSVGELLKMHILAPNYEEQNKIAKVLSTADREIERLQTKLEALKQEKKALMQQLLTGKRRVTINH